MKDKPTGSEKSKDTTGDASQSPTPALMDKEQTTEGAASPDQHDAEANKQEAIKFRWQRFKRWCFDITFTDAVMLLLTGFIAFGTVVSAIAIGLQWREMIGGGKQTDALISAANVNASASRRNAAAAEASLPVPTR